MLASWTFFAGVVLTSLFISLVCIAVWRRRICVRRIGLIAAFPTAIGWAIAYGVWGWQHRMDSEHILNISLGMHVISMTVVAVLYAALGYAVAAGMAVLFARATTKKS
jgi:hypothetical protein